MLKDITIGQYYHGNSFIHKLDPRTKFIFSFIFVIIVFLNDSLYYQASLFALILFIIYLSSVPFNFFIKGLKPILFLLFFAFLMNLFLTDGDVILKLWILKITKQGLYFALLMGIRLVILVFCTSVLTLTSTPIQLTDAIESFLNPLKRFKFPAHEIAMMMTISIRFIPTLIEETDKIMKAQMSRGADFETGSIINRIKNLIPILIPLFISAFKRADDLAIAMESRCYRGGEFRTRLNELKYKNEDYYVMLFLLLIVVYSICFRFFL